VSSWVEWQRHPEKKKKNLESLKGSYVAISKEAVGHNGKGKVRGLAAHKEGVEEEKDTQERAT